MVVTGPPKKISLKILELFESGVGGWTHDDDDDDDDDDDGPGLIPIIGVHQLEPLKRGHDL